MNELDLAFVGRALEHAAEIHGRWNGAIKYSGVAIHTDTQETSDSQHTKRHRAQCACSNIVWDIRRLGAALRKGRDKKAVRLAKEIMLEPVPTSEEVRWPEKPGEEGHDIAELCTSAPEDADELAGEPAKTTAA